MNHGWVDTAWGPVLLEWNERGLVRSYLPEGPVQPTHSGARDATHSGSRDATRSTCAPIPAVLEPAAEWLRGYFAGREEPLPDFPRDWTPVPPAFAAVYRATGSIPFGQARTYGEIAKACGKPKGARFVGTALGRNPWPPFVPCHRILASGGKLGGFTSQEGVTTKRRLLQMEGVLLV